MKFSYDATIPCVIIENCFGKKINQKILKEALKLKRKFVNAKVGSDNGSVVNKKIRTNTTCFYEDIYNHDDPNKKKKIRQTSSLIKAYQNLFGNSDFRQLLSSCSQSSPLANFVYTNREEFQVSRYGDSGQKYDWHIDRFENFLRTITLVYYFHKEPKQYKNGEILLSPNPMSKGKLIGPNPLIKEVTPKNDLMVIFPSNMSHCVKPTTSPKKFEDGRFSANVWVGTQ